MAAARRHRPFFAGECALKDYLLGIWRLRYFWLSLVHIDLQSRYRGSVIGMGWSLLHPLIMTAVICAVFSRFFRCDVPGYGLFLLVGLTTWGFFTAVMSQGCQAFFHNQSYIRQQPAPLAIYPLRVALGAGVHLGLGLLVAMLISCGLNGVGPLLALPALLPALPLLFVFGWSIAILMGIVNVLFQDTQHLIEVALQVLFYMTPIIYPPQMLQERHLGWLVRVNPLATFLALIRQPILDGHVPALATYAVAAATTVMAAAAAGLALRCIERRMIFYL
jgi:lipopolysaccharide transport system permease protein